MNKSFGILTKESLNLLKNIYTVYKCSNFSICIAGTSHERTCIAKTLSYLTGKKLVRILLSTMTDMSDLLGSYEQIAEN
jgi:midasin (ATPase involved in ribosome maturation)